MDAYRPIPPEPRPDPTDPRPRWSRDGERSWFGWGLVVVVALVAVIAVFLLMANEPPQRVAIADLEEQASPMTGEAVTVEGEIEETLSEAALTVTEPGGDESLLVIVTSATIVDGMAPVPDPVDPFAGEGDPLGGVGQVDPGTESEPAMPVIPSSGPVRVIGTVGTFDGAALSEDLAVTLDEDPFASWEGSPYLLADRIDTEFDPSTIPPEDAARDDG